MLQENLAHADETYYFELQASEAQAENDSSNFQIEVELNNLRELILNSSHIPLTDLAIVDQELLLEQLQQIQANLPIELATAVEIVNRRQEIIADAQGYACLIVKSAEEKAHQIVQDSAIVRQAELDGAKIRLRIEQECEQLKQNAIAECHAIQQDADNYADQVLEDMENRLQEMLNIVKNGRQQLNLG